MDTYIGVKLIQAAPMTFGKYNTHRGWIIPVDENPGRKGYLVRYPDGYESWSPKEAFESAYIKLTDPEVITQDVVESFMDERESWHERLDDKTTLVKGAFKTGFVQYETSSCVDPAKYDHNVGVTIATRRIMDSLRGHLGFVLQWARNGLKRT